MISKKDLLIQTNISYGQLYRWKREGLIPEEWFVKTSTQTGQETFFDEDLIIPRINKILDLKDEFSIDDIKNILNPKPSDIVFSIQKLKELNCFDEKIIKKLVDKTSYHSSAQHRYYHPCVQILFLSVEAVLFPALQVSAFQ